MERIGHKVNLGGINTVPGNGVRRSEISSIHLFKPDPHSRWTQTKRFRFWPEWPADNRRKSVVKFLLLVVAAGKSSLSLLLGMQGVG